MIGERIKEIRTLEGLTQQEFADKLGVSRPNITNYESGRREPVDAMIALICQKFKVNEIWLRTGEGEMYQPVSIEEELAQIFGPIMAGDTSARSRMIKAFAKLPEKYYPILEEAILAYAKSLEEDREE